MGGGRREGGGGEEGGGREDYDKDNSISEIAEVEKASKSSPPPALDFKTSMDVKVCGFLTRLNFPKASLSMYVHYIYTNKSISLIKGGGGLIRFQNQSCSEMESCRNSKYEA